MIFLAWVGGVVLGLALALGALWAYERWCWHNELDNW